VKHFKLVARFILLLSSVSVSINIAAQTPSKDDSKTQKIIALTPHLVEMLYAIGAGDRIKGTVEYADYPESAKSIPRIGSYTGVQLEQIIAIDPDLIVASRGTNKEDDLRKLESLGYKMFYTEPKDISDISKDLLRLGDATDLQNNAKQLVEKLDKRYHKIVTRYQSSKPVKVFYQLWHDPLRTLGPKSWISSMIRDCNGRNIFNESDSDYPVVSMESVVMKNPDVIIIPHHSGSALGKQEIWDKWPEIHAVKSNRLFVIHGDILHRFTPRALDGLEQLCEAINSAR